MRIIIVGPQGCGKTTFILPILQKLYPEHVYNELWDGTTDLLNNTIVETNSLEPIPETKADLVINAFSFLDGFHFTDAGQKAHNVMLTNS